MEWKKEIMNRIRDGVKEIRLDGQLFGRVYDPADDMIRVWRRSGKAKAQPVGEGEGATMLPKIVEEPAKVAGVRLEALGDFLTWFEDRKTISIDPYLDGVARQVAIHEMAALTGCLAREAREFTTVDQRLAKRDVMGAAGWIRDNGCHADRLLISPKDEPHLVENEEIIGWWTRPSLVQGVQSPDFVGLMNGLYVYRIPELPEDTSLVYEKKRIIVKRTPITGRFDDPSEPKKLRIAEDCVAWAIDKGALAKVCLKQKP